MLKFKCGARQPAEAGPMEPIASRVSRLNLLFQVKSGWPGVWRAPVWPYRVPNAAFLIGVGTQSMPGGAGEEGAKGNNTSFEFKACTLFARS